MHFPISDADCVRCCLSHKGTVVSSSETSVTVKPEPDAGKPSTTTFRVKSNTKVNGKLEKGSRVTVYYHITDGQNVATRIDVVDYLHGLLVPVNVAVAPTGGACRDVPPNSMRVLFGSTEAYSVSDESAIWKIGGENILVLQKTTHGLSVTTRILDSTGNVVAYIVDNNFFINVHESYRIDRPDDHTLIVSDRAGIKIFSIEFLDPQTIRVLGTFYGPQGQKLIVDEDGLRIGGIRFSGSCFGGNSAIIKID
ncbi:MAG: DUF5666 domain-containing protein [Candidatus Acidiferrales bacterium]